MKQFLFLSLLFSATASFGQSKTVSIKNHAFTFKTIFEETDNTDEPVKKVQVFTGKTKLVTHTISEVWGDCNSESVELGSYTLEDSIITFYSYWARAGDAPVSPFGVRKQVYLVKENGQMILKEAGIYIETSRQNWSENKGVKYLFSKPKNESEKKQLVDYIRKVEKEYHASFVFGAKADSLLKEVKSILKPKIQAETKHWKAHYSKSAFGYSM